MTLRRNVLIIIALTFLGLIATLYQVSQQIVLDGFLEQETRDTQRDIERAVNAVRDDLAALSVQARDWAFWDDTYAYMAAPSTAYERSNLNHPDMFVQTRINLVLLADLEGHIVAARAIDTAWSTMRPLPPGIEEPLAPGSHLLAGPNSTAGVEGLLVLRDGVLLVSAQPILTSGMDGPARGTLIFGRYLDDAMVARLAASTRLNIAVFRLDAGDLPDDVRAAAIEVTARQPLVRAHNEHTVAGYITHPDIFGHPAIILRIEEPRAVYLRGRETIEYFVGALVLVGVVSGIVIILLIEWLVLARLGKLSSAVRRVGGQPGLGAQVALPGSDELAQLAGTISETFTALDQARALEQDRNHVLEQIARRAPLEQIFDSVARLVERQRRGTFCTVLLIRGGRRVFGGGAHLPPAYRDALCARASAITSGAAGARGRWQGLALVAPSDATPAAPDVDITRDFGLHPLWTLPIRERCGDVIGMVMAHSHTLTSATAADLQLADMVCSLCTIALEQRDLTDRLAHQATHDSLTGLPNRVLFFDRLQHALAVAEAGSHQVAVMFIDLDRFKQINDTLGHHAGDIVIHQVGERLARCVGERGLVARMAGDEFLLAVHDVAGQRDIEALADAILAALAQPIAADGRELYVNASIGISVFPRDGADPTTLTSNADAAMYRAKSRGRNTYDLFTASMAAEAAARLQLETELRLALPRGELRLYYQPQVDIHGTLVGFEALLRWQHPRLGLVSPARFIPLAEETGLIHLLGEWALREACHAIGRAGRLGRDRIRVAVNVSSAQFTRAGFVDFVRHALTSAGAPPELLEIELTESLVMSDFPVALATVQQLKALGVYVAIDDFGTGYSSLSYLQRLPVDTVKIDRSFLEGVGAAGALDTNNRMLIQAVTTLAHTLGLTVIAEGVETEQQRAFLVQIGCDSMQGYLFGAPAPLPQGEQVRVGAARRMALLRGKSLTMPAEVVRHD